MMDNISIQAQESLKRSMEIALLLTEESHKTDMESQIKFMEALNKNLAHCPLFISVIASLKELRANNRNKLFPDRSGKIELLKKYSMWLTKEGYMDTDWKDEEPFAIDSFLEND